jgi:hypothetical protein
MFEKLSPQRVRNTSGFVVQVADRETIEYIQGSRTARITVDFAPLTGVYEDTLTDWLADGTAQPMSPQDRVRVLKDIGESLTFMGIRFEWCRLNP